MNPDWTKIRREYLKGGTSYRKLAEKYGVSRSAIEHKARDGGWQEAKSQTQAKAMAKTVEKLANLESETDTRIYNAAMLLMDCLEASVRAMTADGAGLDPDSMRGYTSSLRSIQQVLASRPTQRDIDEQMARIEKLRREAQKDDDKAVDITVRMEGDMDGYAG